MAAHPVMSEQHALRARLHELEDEVDRIRGFIPTLRRELRDRGSSPVPEDHEARLLVLDGRIAATETQIADAKDDARRRKREISEWKLWHTGRTDDDARARLDHEIAWRATEIGKAESRIAELEALMWELLDEREMASLTRPDESGAAPAKDRRVVAAEEALRWAEDELESVRQQLALLGEADR